MHFKLRLIPAAAAAVLLAACGGGSNPSGTTYTPSSGVAVDGYLQFSNVVCDTNDNGVANIGEPYVITRADGSFVFTQGCTHGVIVSGGTIKEQMDSMTGSVVPAKPFTGILRAPAGATVASILTTLMMSANLTQTEIKKVLGLDDKIDLLTTDPGNTTANPDLAKKTSTIQLMTDTVAALSSSVSGDVATHAVFAEVATSFAKSLKAAALAPTPTVLISATGGIAETQVAKLASAALTAVATSTNVPVSVTGLLSAKLAKAGVDNIATVAAPAMTQEASAILAAAAADIAQVLLAKQNDLINPSKPTVVSSINTAISSSQLTPTTTPDALLALKAQVATEAAKPAATTTPPTPTPSVSGTVSFSETGVALLAYGDNGGGYAALSTDPTDANNKVAKIVKKAGDMSYMGATIDTSATTLNVMPVVLTATNKMLSLRIYSPAIGEKVLLKLENSATDFLEVQAVTTKANAWETLTFSFAAAGSFQKVNLMPHFGTTVSADTTFYVDDLLLIPTGATTAPDTIPPTLTITDNVAATTATGPVTFTFTFSEDVGSSFTASGIAVTGGTAGTLTKVSATSYTLTVTPSTNASGTVSVSVATGAFKDLANNVNTAAATAMQAFDTTSVANPYIYLANNALTLSDGAASPTKTTYTMAQFQSTAGINLKWPMSSATALELNLAENGTFTMAQGQTLQAAVSITQDTPSGSGEVQAYIDNVTVTKNGSSIQVTVPSVAKALVYGVSSDGKTKAVIDFASAVAGITNTLSSATNAVSTIVLGDVVNYAVNGVSNDFTGMYGLTGKYKVSIVVTQLPLRQADGSAFPVVTVQVPTVLDASGNVVPASVVPVTGYGLVGYINLVK